MAGVRPESARRELLFRRSGRVYAADPACKAPRHAAQTDLRWQQGRKRHMRGVYLCRFESGRGQLEQRTLRSLERTHRPLSLAWAGIRRPSARIVAEAVALFADCAGQLA